MIFTVCRTLLIAGSYVLVNIQEDLFTQIGPQVWI